MLLRYTHFRPMSSDRSGERSDGQNAVMSSKNFYLVTDIDLDCSSNVGPKIVF